MANYWFNFMEMVEILMINTHWLKIQDWSMFTDSLHLTIPLNANLRQQQLWQMTGRVLDRNKQRNN